MKKTEEKVIRLIRDYNLINEGDRILLALSGGADSVFLLYFLDKFRKKYKISLGAMHINHMLRGKAADEDEQFCRNLCRNLDTEYHTVKKNVNTFSARNKVSVEEAGRIIRYKELDRTAQKYNYSKIATAHNSSDNAETVLLNLIKGTGLRGLSGIPVIRGSIIRPILSLRKEEINTYLLENNISFRNDISNASDDYERNFIRNNIMPLIKGKLNPVVEDTIFNNSVTIRSHYSDILAIAENLVNKYAEFTDNRLFLNDRFAAENQSLKAEAIKIAVERNFSVQLSFKDITALSRLLTAKRGSKIKIHSGLAAWKEENKLVIFHDKSDEFLPVGLDVNGKVRLNSKSLYINEAEKSGFTYRKPEEEYIAADDVDTTFQVRQWSEGDRFFPLGMRGSKKISDYLNEKKIETYLKNKVLVLVNRDRIVWVIGLRLDNRFRVTENTKRVLKLCLK